ncbi:hypothetical protein KSX_36520 [Ktedonospora formicarum]|uniref:histidine kinase n=2 Tax=Ktedonospora formicarum TaxID=2778364 RepID=A0A8J3I6A1_9CHLR|nr:hypothetical protein KSX_36520 [Ktedonospora formicarum]
MQGLLAVVGICLFAWGIRRAHRKAEMVRQQLDVILEAFPDAISVYNSSGRLVRCNRATRDLMVERRRDSMCQAEVFKPWTLEDGDAISLVHEQSPLMRSLKGETVLGYEVCYLDGRKQGQMLSIDSFPVVLDKHKVESVIQVTHDISPLYAMKCEMLKHAGRFQALLNSITDAAYILDQEGNIVQANASARMALVKLEAGALSSALLFRTGIECQLLDAEGELLATHALPVSRLLRGEELVGEQMVEVRVRSLHAHDLRLNVYGAPMFDGEGNLCGAVVITRDVTERQGLALQDERDAAQQRMEQFLGIVSHELRNPLTTISMSLQYSRSLLKTTTKALLEDDPLRVKLHEIYQLLARAERQVGVQDRIINDLFEVSSLQFKHFSLHLAHCDLYSTLRVLVSDFQSSHREREIRLVPANYTGELIVVIDRERIAQVVNNYMQNACKYAPEGSPIDVRVVAGDNEVCIGVKDEGPGLAPEEQERVWELFYRVPGIHVNAGVSKGAGLGLYICRTIIEQHQGQVGVESAPGAGSIFWFTIPFAQR